MSTLVTYFSAERGVTKGIAEEFASVSLQVICPTSEKYRYFLPSEHLELPFTG